MGKQSVSFESKLNQLEELVHQLEQEDLSLEDSLKVFEQGVKLSRQCQSALEKAEQKIIQLTQNDASTEIQTRSELQDRSSQSNDTD
jgi:exodeoxyribonuclease VII small subunit